MSFDSYTQNIPLTQKANFWTNYVSALKGIIPKFNGFLTLKSITAGSQDLCAADLADTRTWYPSITETVPEFPDLKKEFGKIEDQMLSRRRAATPLTPVLPDAHDR
jgi:hypothetical protein